MKIDQNYNLISQKISTKPTVVTVAKRTNHVFVVDVSGSMSGELPHIRTQLKNKLTTLMNPGDTISIIWFSGRTQAGILKEEVEVKSLTTLSDLHDAIDRWLKPVCLTAFLKPLELAKEVVKRISANRPDSVFSLIFLTDGYNNDCSWSDVISTLKTMDRDFASSTFVEYGYYADSKKLTEMAAIMGGEKISCDGFDEFEPMFDKKISTGQTGGKKVLVQLECPSIYDFAYSVSPSGGIILYSIDNGQVLVNEDTPEIHFFSQLTGGQYLIADPTVLYAGIYVLSDKLMNEDAERIFYALGDQFYYKMLANAFGKQKLNAFKTAISECVADLSKQFPEGKTTIAPVDDNAYCLMNLINDLSEMPDCRFYPNHSEFNYNRIGRRRVAVVNECEELADIETKFVVDDPNAGYPMTDLVWNEMRANLSVRCMIRGTVELSDNRFGIKSVPSYRYKTYTLIKDGILNVSKLPVNYTKEIYDLLVSKGFNAEIQENYIILDLASLPLVNRSMIKKISAKDLANQEWELLKVQARKKVYDYYKKLIFPKESKSFIETYGQEAADWLKDLGITDFGGYAPKTAAAEATDVYMSVNLLTKVKGLSSFPKVEDVVEKINKGAALKLSEELMAVAINEYNAQMASPIYSTLPPAEQTKVLQNYLTTKSNELNVIRRKALAEIAKIKFSLILSKKWFVEFKSFDENTMNLILDNHSVDFTFDMVEKEEKV